MKMIRKYLKSLIKLLFLALAWPLYALFIGLSLTGNSDRIFNGFSQFLSIIPGKLGIYIRAAFYRLACPDTSDEISIGFLTLLSHRDTTIKQGVYIGPQCNIGKCSIDKNTLVGSGVHILSGNRQHGFSERNKLIQEQGGKYQKIEIGKDCWIGNQSVVMASLASSCIIAAGSVLTKPVEEKEIILAGNPAKKINDRFPE